MKQISERLIADMRWRLSPAGKRQRPGRAECQSWGSAAIPWMGTLLGGCASQMVLLGLTLTAFEAELFFIAFTSITLMFLSLPAAYLISLSAQRRSDLKAYSRLVNTNERFALVEYSKLLQRQLHAARIDPALGGAAEIRRLGELQSKINQLIQDGAGEIRGAGASQLSSEADLAESIIEAYSTGKDDGLAALDSRLPEELRARLDDLDDEAGRGSGGREKASHG